MKEHIKNMNKNILQFAKEQKLTWIEHSKYKDIFLTIYNEKIS